MIDDHLTNITEIDVVSLDRGGMHWISYDPSIALNDFEKVHSGGSSDSCILRSMSNPDLYMGVKREDFFKLLLSKRTDELLFSARALVAQMKEELVTRPDGSTGRGRCEQAAQELSRRDEPRGQEWAEAYDSEYQGFLEHGTLKIV